MIVHVPFVIGLHCMVHQTNLTIQTHSDLHLVFCIENLLQCLYGYFSHRRKRHLEFIKLVEIMETKGNKISTTSKLDGTL
jgi:hypothetical protein